VNRRTLAAIVLAGIATWACTVEEPAPQVLRVGAIPDQASEAVKAQHWPTLEIVCVVAAVRCEWVPIDTYEGVVEALGTGRIDMAYLGAVTYSEAHKRYRVIPLAIRDGDMRFSSILVVRTGSLARRLHDLEGSTFAFGNRSSTSGHIMARYFLTSEGVQPEHYFSRVDYTHNHGETLERVASGQVDAGVVNSSIALHNLGPGSQYEGRLRVIWESPAYVDYVWCVRQEIPAALRTRLTEAFLDINVERPQDAAALRAEGAHGFLPANQEDYDLVAAVIRELKQR
jgi:phosphonate transport system substrate-binding protein